MKRFYSLIILAVSAAIIFLSLSAVLPSRRYCLIGAFLADNPTAEDIRKFKTAFGKKPFFIAVFIGWGELLKEKTIKDIYSEGSVLMVTLEPWNPAGGEPLDYDKIISGGYNDYVVSFARQIKSVPGTVFIRFAHEANGDWYPWSVSKIGTQKYIALYRYLKDKFDALGVVNAKWIFSINHEDVPADRNNNYLDFYPGDKYVDYVGIDGYNWGNTKPWSRWLSFDEIFSDCYREITRKIKKPVLITEFSSTSGGGDKAAWIKDALNTIKKMKDVKGFVLFNQDKETDWSLSAYTLSGRNFKQQLKSGYFKENYTE